ncbi:MAG: hypothetical protein ACYDG2_09815 [Ruminiclostridium sp.]
MTVTGDNIDSDIFETVRCSIDHVKIKASMPSDVKPDDMKKCLAPTLVMAGEFDCLFPAELVIPQAQNIISICTTYILQGRGHMHHLTEAEKKIIVDFLSSEK